MPTGYSLKPNIQMKIEDERAGRLDFVYETSLTASECLDRIGRPVSGKLSEYETKTEDGILYIFFTDQAKEIVCIQRVEILVLQFIPFGKKGRI